MLLQLMNCNVLCWFMNKNSSNKTTRNKLSKEQLIQKVLVMEKGDEITKIYITNQMRIMLLTLNGKKNVVTITIQMVTN